MAAYFITGTDTNAGKTVVTAALLRAFARKDMKARAFNCIAPHLAAKAEGKRLSVKYLAQSCRKLMVPGEITLLEGTGGLYVPLNENEYMLDLAKALRLPMLLVVCNRLGCVNHALLSLDAMENAGLDIAGMILCRTRPENAANIDADIDTELLHPDGDRECLAEESRKRGIPLLASLPYCPALNRNHENAWNLLAGELKEAAHYLAFIFPAALESAEGGDLLQFDRAHLWHPYTSATRPLAAREVAGTSGARIFLDHGLELIDGMSSWWCAIHGYGNPRLVRALQKQAASFSHVMFGGLTHKPAVELARKLLKLLPPSLEHIFYADSGSVAVEVALKMAVQYWRAKGCDEKKRFAALRGAYHGDTLGAMSLCDPVTGMHGLFRGIVPEQLFVQRPTCRFDTPYDSRSFLPMLQTLQNHAHELAAVIVEPIVQGAGGMWFYHPQYLNSLRALCDELDILLIADEIATGFGRTGKMFACEWSGVAPDIMCVGKALTGGMLTMSAVIASRRVAHGISDADAEHGGGLFMHGPTFMGNPLACAAACASLDELLSSPWKQRVANMEAWLKRGLSSCKGIPGVNDVRVLGAVGVVEMAQIVNVEAWQKFFLRCGVWIRPFGKTVYLMPPFIAEETEIELLCSAVRKAALSAARHGGQPQCKDLRLSPKQ